MTVSKISKPRMENGKMAKKQAKRSHPQARNANQKATVKTGKAMTGPRSRSLRSPTSPAHAIPKTIAARKLGQNLRIRTSGPRQTRNPNFGWGKELEDFDQPNPVF